MKLTYPFSYIILLYNICPNLHDGHLPWVWAVNGVIYGTVLYYALLNCMDHTIYSTILYSIVLYCTVLSLNCTWCDLVQELSAESFIITSILELTTKLHTNIRIVLYDTELYCIVYSTVLYSTVLQCPIWYNRWQHIPVMTGQTNMII